MSSPRALIVVDVQNDFLPGGALPVPDGDAVIAPINELMDSFDVVFATQDWHPRDHGSFAANHPGKKPGDVIDLNGLSQMLWPVHCVQNTPGADFAPGLCVEQFDAVFRKGADPKVDSYSGLFDNGRRHSTGLAEALRARGIKEVHVCGLATDFCVKFTALDALREGFAVTLLERATRGVNLKPGDVDAAIEAMRSAGVIVAPV